MISQLAAPRSVQGRPRLQVSSYTATAPTAAPDVFTPSEASAPKGWVALGQSPNWKLAVSSLPGPLAVAVQAGAQESSALTDYLREAGRPDPEKEAAYLRAGNWGAMSAEQAAVFYVLGHQQYPADLKNRDELIELSLQELGRYLERGMMGELPMEKRLELCHHLLENVPVQPTETILDFEGNSEWSYPVFTSEAYTRVHDLHKVANYDKDQKISFHVGAQSWYSRFSPPDEPVDRIQATRDYTRYLKMVTHAEGRQDSKRVWGDDHHALSACNVVYNGLHRDPDKVATFESFLKVTGTPWASFGFTEMSHALPEADRGQFNDHIVGLYREVRQYRGVSAQETISQIEEEKFVETKAQWAYQVATQRTEGQSVEEALQTAEPLFREFVSTFPRMAHMEVYAHLNALRGPEQSFEQVFRQYMDLNQQLRGQNDALSGLYVAMNLFKATDNAAQDIQPLVDQMSRLPKDRRVGRAALDLAGTIRGLGESVPDSFARLVDAHLTLAEGGLDGDEANRLVSALFGGSQGPQAGIQDALKTVVQAVEPGSMPPEVMGQLVKAALADERKPVNQNIRQLAEQYSLTGALDGLDKVRERISGDLEKGALVGQPDALFEKFHHHARLQSLMTDDRSKIVEAAYDAIRPQTVDRGPDIDLEENYVSIGGIMLDRM